MFKKNKCKIFISASLGWIVLVGYLVWINGVRAPGRYTGFNWEEWLWFGIIPAIIPYFFYFIWKPEEFSKCYKNFKTLIKKR